MRPLRIAFTDTHEHLATFFIAILQSRYDVEIVDISASPDFLLFGDDNFGNNNLKVSRESFASFLKDEMNEFVLSKFNKNIYILSNPCVTHINKYFFIF